MRTPKAPLTSVNPIFYPLFFLIKYDESKNDSSYTIQQKILICILRAILFKIINKWIISPSQRDIILGCNCEEAQKCLKNVSLLYLIRRYPWWVDFWFLLVSWVRQRWLRDLLLIIEISIISFCYWIKTK